jgi:Lipocalin-like domain
MNPRNAFTFSAIAAIGLALLPANVGAQQGIAQQLVGAWTIVSWQDTAPNGTKRELTNPKGVLIFDAAGRYAQVVAREDRSKFKSPSEPTAEELAAATEDYFAANGGPGQSARPRSFSSCDSMQG